MGRASLTGHIGKEAEAESLAGSSGVTCIYRSMREVVTILQVSAGFSFFLINRLTPCLPLPSLSPLQYFPREFPALCILCFSNVQAAPLWPCQPRRMLGCCGAEKQAEKQEDPTGPSKQDSRMHGLHTHAHAHTCMHTFFGLFKKKNKVCGE